MAPLDRSDSWEGAQKKKNSGHGTLGSANPCVVLHRSLS